MSAPAPEVAVHPAAELFPLMTGADFAELVADVRANGLVDPIVRTPDGHILDGRNRYRACAEAGIEPQFRTYDGEPWRFVISTNLHRRHLTDGQRAMIAAKIAERANGQRGAGKASSSDEAFLPELPPTRLEAARMLSVSPAQVDRARSVERNGTEALRAAVEAGSVPVSTAARMAEQPVEDQDTFVREVESGADPRKAASALRSIADRVRTGVRDELAARRSEIEAAQETAEQLPDFVLSGGRVKSRTCGI